MWDKEESNLSISSDFILHLQSAVIITLQYISEWDPIKDTKRDPMQIPSSRVEQCK